MDDEPSVTLAQVGEATLAELGTVAVADAGADDVTPSAGPGEGWSPLRVEWLRTFHRERRGGIGGPAGEAEWAILVDGRVVGSVRFRRTDDPGVFETGIWLGRRARAQGIGFLALRSVLRIAEVYGAHGVRADTTADNAAALWLLRRLGFDIAPAGEGGGVPAMLRLAGR